MPYRSPATRWIRRISETVGKPLAGDLLQQGAVGYPRSARRALRMTARSMTSCKSAPATGGR